MTRRLTAQLDKLSADSREAEIDAMRLELARHERHVELLRLLVPEGYVTPGWEMLMGNGMYSGQRLPGYWRVYINTEQITAKLQEPVFGAGRGVLRHADLILGYTVGGDFEPDGSATPDDRKGYRGYARGRVLVVVADDSPVRLLQRVQTMSRVLEKQEGEYAAYRGLEYAPNREVLLVDREPPAPALRAFTENGVAVVLRESEAAPLRLLNGPSEES